MTEAPETVPSCECDFVCCHSNLQVCRTKISTLEIRDNVCFVMCKIFLTKRSDDWSLWYWSGLKIKRSRVNTTKHGVAPHTSPFERVRCAKQGKKIYGLDSS